MLCGETRIFILVEKGQIFKKSRPVFFNFLFHCLTNCAIIENGYHKPIKACVYSEHLARRADGF